MSIDIKNIFNREENAFGKLSVRRTIASDDPSFQSPPKPITENYSPSNHDRFPSGQNELKSDPLSVTDSKEDLAEKARISLEEALEHSDRDVVIKNALEAILETYEGKIEDYKTEHQIPGEQAKLLEDPPWSKLSNLINIKRHIATAIKRVGDPPKTDQNLILSDLASKIKACKAGMSIEEIKEADKMIDNLFAPNGGFRKKF